MTEDDVLAHRRIWEALPWLVNGSATPEQREQVLAHLPGCADCRGELALQQRIHAAMNQEPAGGAAEASLARLFDRIDAPLNPHGLDRHDGLDDDPPVAVAVVTPRRSLARYGLAALLVAQSIGLVVLGHQLAQRPAADDAGAAYRTLSRTETNASPATIRFVPAPELTVQQLQAMLDEAGVRIVDSRERSAIYGLAPVDRDVDRDGAASAEAIARLRGKPGVLLVEPIAAPR